MRTTAGRSHVDWRQRARGRSAPRQPIGHGRNVISRGTVNEAADHRRGEPTASAESPNPAHAHSYGNARTSRPSPPGTPWTRRSHGIAAPICVKTHASPPRGLRIGRSCDAVPGAGFVDESRVIMGNNIRHGRTRVKPHAPVSPAFSPKNQSHEIASRPAPVRGTSPTDRFSFRSVFDPAGDETPTASNPDPRVAAASCASHSDHRI